MTPTAPTDTPLLSPQMMRRLAHARLAPRRQFSGRVQGERLSRRKGVSIEFADYREYADGDDPRHLDWSILARLDRPTIRTYQDEDDLAVYLALDTSASMDFGEPTKFTHASRIAAAVGFVALSGQDAVYPLALAGGQASPGRPWRGSGSWKRLAGWIDAQKPTGNRGLAAAIARFAGTGSVRAGLVILITDGLDPDAPDAVRTLAARGHEVALIQTLSPIEIDPDLEGDLRLIDAETGEAVEMTAHREAIETYRRNLESHCARLDESVRRGGGRYFRTLAGDPVDELVLRDLRRAGLVA